MNTEKKKKKKFKINKLFLYVTLIYFDFLCMFENI